MQRDRRAILWVAALLSLLSVQTVAAATPEVRMLEVTETCQDDGLLITVTAPETNTIGVEYLIVIGDGYAYHYLEPGESKDWLAQAGHGYAVYVEATVIAEGDPTPCFATTTTSTTSPGTCHECGDNTTTTTLPSTPSTSIPPTETTSVPESTVPGTTPTTVKSTAPAPTQGPASTVVATLPYTGPSQMMSWWIPGIPLLVGAGLVALSRKREDA